MYGMTDRPYVPAYHVRWMVVRQKGKARGSSCTYLCRRLVLGPDALRILSAVFEVKAVLLGRASEHGLLLQSLGRVFGFNTCSLVSGTINGLYKD